MVKSINLYNFFKSKFYIYEASGGQMVSRPRTWTGSQQTMKSMAKVGINSRGLFCDVSENVSDLQSQCRSY